MFSKFAVALIAFQISSSMGRHYDTPSPTKAPTEEDMDYPGVNTCHRDCIEISEFDIDTNSAVGDYLENRFGGAMGGASAFTGRYCWKSDCECYEKDYDDYAMYDVTIEIEYNKITFDYMNMDSTYEAVFSKYYYGDLGCIEDYFNSEQADGGSWKLFSGMDEKIDNKDIDVKPQFNSGCHCVE